MSKFLKTVSKTYTFQGDTITASFKRLTRAQMMAITPLSPKVIGKNEDGPIIEEQTTGQQVAFMEVTIGALKDNVVTFESGELVDENDQPMEFEDIVEEAYFTQLVSEMTKDLLSESMVDEKK